MTPRAQERDVKKEPRPAYVAEALNGLTPTQRMYVRDGSIHGDCTMTTVRALKAKGLFHLVIDSPDGQHGFMHLTPLGVTVQGILRERADLSKSASQP